MDFVSEFAGRGVVITGAAGLFGSGLARTFAAKGAKVCVTDRSQDELDALLPTLGGADDSFVHAAELTDASSMQELVEAVGERWGAPHTVINNAAVYPSGFLLDISIEDWDRVMDVNLRAPYALTRNFARQMIGHGMKGNFINISSGASRRMRRTAVPYCVSKAALDRLTKGFAIELAEFGIRVNALEPGFSAGSSVSHLSEEHVKATIAGIPLGRPSSIEDIGPAALYLASDAAAYVTGATLSVDGGNSIGSLAVYQEKKRPL